MLDEGRGALRGLFDGPVQLNTRIARAEAHVEAIESPGRKHGQDVGARQGLRRPSAGDLFVGRPLL
eukprot:12673295-Heterocapsa_arctica.AAC.1